MNNFKIGDIVLFSREPNCAPWHKGKIVANNFAMCNLPDFFGKPVYYISEVDDNDNVLDDRRTFAIDKDSEYILKFLPGMEAMIGKSTCIKNIYAIDIEKEFPEQVADADYIRWKNQFKKVSKADYLEIPGLKEMHDDEQKWKERIDKKLNDINDKLNKLLLSQRTWTDPYPTYPWTPGTPSNPWYDINKVYCETETETHETHNYTSSIPIEEAHKYQETYSETNKLNNKK